MKGRILQTLSIAAVLALGVTGLSQAEVWVELDGSGRLVATHIPSTKNNARLWRTTGEAPSRGQVLNPEGAARGDGRPDIAVDPVSNIARAVWSVRSGGGWDIVTSVFDGHSWSEPIPVTGSFGIDDLDPRIAVRADGLTIVTWWTNTAIPSVLMAHLPRGGTWHYDGIVSGAAEKAKLPAIRQEGSITILAYRTPGGLRIATFAIVTNEFGDGPTPFPRDDGGGSPIGGDGGPNTPSNP